MNEAIL
jgi:hypothetical protein